MKRRFLSSLTLGRFTPGSDQKRSGRVVADVCSPSYRFVWQIDRTYAVASQIFLIGQHFAPRQPFTISHFAAAREAVRVLRPVGGFLFEIFAMVSSYVVVTTATRSQKLPSCACSEFSAGRDRDPDRLPMVPDQSGDARMAPLP
jgi:hypothetical protein